MAWRKKTKRQQRTVSNPARRMLIRQMIVGGVLIAVLGLSLWGVWEVTRLPLFTIERVEATGGITISPRTVEAVATDELSGTYYRLIPKQFAYFYPRHAITTRLAAIPRMKAVTVNREGRVVRITYTEHEPFALWCTSDRQECVFIDADGYGFAKAPSLRGAAYVRYVNHTLAPEVGVTGVPPEIIRTSSTFIDTAAASFNMRPVEVWFDDRDITYRLGGGGEIRTSIHDSVIDVLENLEAILESEAFAHLEPGNFEYVDLRYGNKVFVQEVLPETATSTATSSTEHVNE